MKLPWTAMLAAGVLCACSNAAYAQIYACVAEDGTRIFSDERCGPDAKVVRGITSKKRETPGAGATPKAAKVVRPAAELEALSVLCDAGDMKACKDWTLGGGPGLLRDKERKAELECEAGSLAACEQRYCADRIDSDCRARVLRTAPLAGETWYLREEERGRDDGRTHYRIRCVPEGATTLRDVTIACAALPGPARCQALNAEQGFARLDQAAARHCGA